MVLEDNKIYIVPNNIKKELLLEISRKKLIKNIKFFTLKEFINNLTFTYDEKAIYYLMEKYNYKYDNSKTILNNLYYIEDKEYNNKKLDNLVKIKNEITDLLIYNPLFKDYIKDKKIYIYGYNFIDKYDLNILKDVDYEIINKKTSNYEHIVHEFKTIFDEIIFISNKIRELIDKGVSLNKIKIIDLPEEYSFLIKEIFKMQKINITVENESIYSTNIVQEYLKLFDQDKSIEELDYIFKDEDSLFIYNKIIDVLNRYNFVTNKDIKREILVSEFKNIKLNKDYINQIGIERLEDINDDEYAFILGFNDGNYPKVTKDEDYLTDKEKELLGISTSLEKTNIERNNMIDLIRSTKNLTISYKHQSTFNEYYPSTLLKDLKYEVVKGENNCYDYSNDLNKLRLSKDLDNYVKYLEKSDELENLFSNYEDIDYNSFDNRYKKINKDNFKKYIDNSLRLSYSSINNFYKCKFNYYLSNILKIDKFETTFEIFVGNLFHHILSICFKDDFDFEKEYESYLKDYELDSKDKFFVNKLKKDLLFIIETIKKQMTYTNFENYEFEKEFVIDKSTDIKVSFIGYVDKMLKKEHNGKTLFVIVDYKTGEPKLKLNNTYYGLDLQLPVYLYLSKNNNIDNSEVVGFYLQHILTKNVKLDSNKTIDQIKEDNLKLQGYTISDEFLISELDKTYENSRLIRSLSKTQNGFSGYSKLLTKTEMDNLYKLVDKKIDNARDEIIDVNFEIDPKRIGKDNVSCTYCKFKDICFMNESNIKNLKEMKLDDFLGGEE